MRQSSYSENETNSPKPRHATVRRNLKVGFHRRNGPSGAAIAKIFALEIRARIPAKVDVREGNHGRKFWGEIRTCN